MPCAVNCRECEVSLPSFEVPRKLIIEEVWAPFLSDVPPELMDPLTCTFGGHGTISGTGIHKDPIVLIQEGIHPDGCIYINVVL